MKLKILHMPKTVLGEKGFSVLDMGVIIPWGDVLPTKVKIDKSRLSPIFCMKFEKSRSRGVHSYNFALKIAREKNN